MELSKKQELESLIEKLEEFKIPNDYDAYMSLTFDKDPAKYVSSIVDKIIDVVNQDDSLLDYCISRAANISEGEDESIHWNFERLFYLITSEYSDKFEKDESFKDKMKSYLTDSETKLSSKYLWFQAINVLGKEEKAPLLISITGDDSEDLYLRLQAASFMAIWYPHVEEETQEEFKKAYISLKNKTDDNQSNQYHNSLHRSHQRRFGFLEREFREDYSYIVEGKL